MPDQTNKPNDHLVLLPLYGTILFIALYIIATLLYPGGSQLNKQARGFSWSNNYWCTLMNETAINGKPNTARPVAIAAMFLLCATLAFFWYIFPKHADLNKRTRLAIQVSGLLGMGITMFLFTGLHDIVINVGGFFGVIALLGTFLGLYKNKWTLLLWFGIFNLLLVALNNYLYWATDMAWLPVVQKFSFLSFLVWFCWITVRMYRMGKKNNLT